MTQTKVQNVLCEKFTVTSMDKKSRQRRKMANTRRKGLKYAECTWSSECEETQRMIVQDVRGWKKRQQPEGGGETARGLSGRSGSDWPCQPARSPLSLWVCLYTSSSSSPVSPLPPHLRAHSILLSRFPPRVPLFISFLLSISISIYCLPLSKLSISSLFFYPLPLITNLRITLNDQEQFLWLNLRFCLSKVKISKLKAYIDLGNG